jgi:PGM1 C-terminal domain
VARHGLGFDHTRQTGVIFHMMSALSERGRVGLTAVGDDHAEADRLYAPGPGRAGPGGDSRPRAAPAPAP